MKLLTRDEFRQAVFDRDGHRCVVCGAPAADAHHILEPRLFPDGGYYLDNGASLCEQHHIQAEQTRLSVEQIRQACGVPESRKVLPPHLYEDQPYDKWGNPIMGNEMRTKGELFDDPSVQKILAEGGVLGLFTKYVRYPRTHHLPWSDSMVDDDRMIESLDGFVGEPIVVTVKMDGENTSLYNDYLHARSLSPRKHVSRDWIKSFHARFAHDIPEGWRVCGENLFAEHTIHYGNLASYFYAFSVWNDKNVCLSWDESLEWFQLLGLSVVPVLYEGPWDEEMLRGLHKPVHDGCECEGYVVRVRKAFHYRDYRRCVGKYVRKGQVGRHDFWTGRVVRNELR